MMETLESGDDFGEGANLTHMVHEPLVKGLVLLKVLRVASSLHGASLQGGNNLYFVLLWLIEFN